MENNIIVAYVAGAITYGFVVYLLMRIKLLEAKLKNIPTPEELAKEILKVKLPFNDLPPDMQNEINAAMSKAPKSPLGKTPNNKDQSSYIG